MNLILPVEILEIFLGGGGYTWLSELVTFINPRGIANTLVLYYPSVFMGSEDCATTWIS